MLKRILSAFLLSMFLISCFALYGCEEAEESSVASEVSFEDKSFYGYNVPENADLGGKTYRVLTTAANHNAASFQIQPEDNELFSAESATASLTAIAECARLVEERLNIELEEECIFTFSRYGGEMYKRIYADAMSLTADYVFTMPCVIEAAMLAEEGLLYDLNGISTINLNNEWWCKPYNEAVNFAGKTYFAISDIGYVSKDATMFVAFNKKMADSYRISEKYGCETLYEMVDKKLWTQDAMYEMAKSVYQDLNKNNRCDIGDINGIAAQAGFIQWMLAAANETIITKDENDLPVLSVKNERAISIINDAQEYALDPQSGFISADDYFGQSNVPVPDVIVPEFKADRCLFFYNCILNLENIRDMESDFGVLPSPLYDESQEEYASSIGAWTATAICVPVSTVGEDVTNAGIIIEALSAVCRSKLNPVYYEQTLQYQIARDDDSMRMLDIIFNNRVPEPAEVYGWGDMANVVTNMLKAQKGTFISAYESAEKQTQAAIEATIESLTKER
ncbi:MAG: hypothetical protein IJO64_02460 [Clostridia bacterium]|nr:hypothetical protein [Clostridia bacterium]